MKTQSNWWNGLARACWAKLHADSNDHPRIPTREQVMSDLDAEYMAAARNGYRSHFGRAAILVYPQLNGAPGELSDDLSPAQDGIDGLPEAHRVEEVGEDDRLRRSECDLARS